MCALRARVAQVPPPPAVNMPRAAININDGLGGGNNITQNLIFNTCRQVRGGARCRLLTLSDGM